SNPCQGFVAGNEIILAQPGKVLSRKKSSPRPLPRRAARRSAGPEQCKVATTTANGVPGPYKRHLRLTWPLSLTGWTKALCWPDGRRRMADEQLPHLETFARAAELCSFTAAAKVLGLTQAAVSQRIHALEQELGVPLSTRQGGRVLLTDAGRRLHEYAQRI